MENNIATVFTRRGVENQNFSVGLAGFIFMKNEAEMTMTTSLGILRSISNTIESPHEVSNLTEPFDMTCITLHDSTREVGETSVPLAVSGSVTL